MEQTKSNTVSVVLAIVITAIVVGGGVYYWQTKNSAVETVILPYNGSPGPSDPTPATQKSLEEYFATRDQFRNDGITKDPSELGLKELANIAVTCPDSAGTPCGGNLLILSKDSLHSGSQEFYLAFTMGTGYMYYGPFMDDLQRIVNESKTIKSLERSY
ncbi:MAG: hypothetical protein ACD_76C00044G0022 [uncultured bacterium]|nr:MAG: hypothetical protein ACD_76C00044G0022 [uncultured bacterium]HBD05197.1 hypothetical protein [Candidatus Uhrbacteria bacterium]